MSVYDTVSEESLKCYNKIIVLSAGNKILKEWQFLVPLARMAVVNLEKELGKSDTIYEKFTVHTD
jgi:hypothetical protein